MHSFQHHSYLLLVYAMYTLFGIYAVLRLSSTAFATCYFPNGNAVDSDTACNPNALESACCFDNQACLSNGLCVSDPRDPEKMRLHRGTCTDHSWKSGNCPRECLDVNNNGAPVYSCNVTDVASYCCYDDCKCESPFEVFSFPATKPSDVYTITIIGEAFTQTHVSTTILSTATSSSPARSVSASAAASSALLPVSASASASATTAPAPKPSSKSTNATALGAGLGVGIPVVAALLIGAFFLWRRRNRPRPAYGTVERPSELPYVDNYPLQTKHAHYAQSEEQG